MPRVSQCGLHAHLPNPAILPASHPLQPSVPAFEEDLRRPRHALEPCLAHFTAMEDSANASLLQRRREIEPSHDLTRL